MGYLFSIAILVASFVLTGISGFIAPPTVTITSGPEDGTVVDSSSVLFSWTAIPSDNPVDSFLVNLAGPLPDSFVTTNESHLFSDLLDGAYDFCIVAKDSIGELSDTVCRSFSIQLPPAPNQLPTIDIIDGPSADETITFDNPQFAWTASDVDGAVDSFFVSLSGVAPDSLVTQDTLHQFTELKNGDYTFCVTAQDDNGGLSSPACRPFSVDVAPENELPTVQITSGPENGSVIDLSNPLFAWSAQDLDGTIDSSFVVLSGAIEDSLGTIESSIQYENLVEGAYQFCVYVQDNAGAFSAPDCASFTILFNTPPTVQIDNGPEEDSTITFSNPAFTWSGNDLDGTITTFIVDLQGPTPDSFATTNTFVQFSPRENGEYVFCVEAVDDDSALSDPACRAFIIDVPTENQAPIVTIENGPEAGSTISFDNPAFSWSASDSDSEIDSFYVELRGPSSLTFGTQSTFHQFTNLLNGEHEFCVQATDIDGLSSEWTCRLFTVLVPLPNTPPTVLIENGPAEGDTLLFNTPAFTWMGEDSDGTVDSFYVDLQGPSAVQFATTSTFHQFNALDNGAYSFCIQSLDNQGALSESLCRGFIILTDIPQEAPSVVIENGPQEDSTITFNNPAFSWSGEDPDGTVDSYNIELVGPTPLTLSTTDTFYQFPPLSSGSYTFCIQAVDNTGMLSGWACRQFSVNSAITGTLLDLLISKDGAILQIPLADETVDVYQSEAFIASATTNNQGIFSLQGQFGSGDYTLKTESSEDVEGFNDPVTIQRVIPISEQGAYTIHVPRTLMMDQFETLNTLSRLEIHGDLLEGFSESQIVGSLYNVAPLISLLRDWLDSLGPDIDLTLETMQRLHIATTAMERALEDVTYVSHEQAESLFDMLRVYLIANEFIAKSFSTLDTLGDPNLELAVGAILHRIDALNYEMAVNTPAKYASALSPSPYDNSFYDALLAMYETILQQAIFEPAVGTRFTSGFAEDGDQNRIKIAAIRHLLTDIYLSNTGPFLQNMTNQARLFDVQGGFPDAFEQVLSIHPSSLFTQSQDLLKTALTRSDSLQTLAQTTQAAQHVSTLINSQSSYLTLNEVTNALGAASFEELGKGLVLTGSGLNSLQELTGQSVEWAFNPDSLFSSLANTDSVSTLSSLQLSDDTSLSLDEEAYLTALDDILWSVEQGHRGVVVARLEALMESDRLYESALASLQGGLWVFAEDLLSSKAELQTTFEDMQEERFASLQDRISLYAELLRYAGFQAVDLASLTAQRDSIAHSIQVTSVLTKTIKATLNEPRPYVTIEAHQPSTATITPGIPAEIIVTIRNTGLQEATDLTMTLKGDSLMSFLSPPSFIIPSLAPDQETIIRWEFVVQEYVHSTGLYIVEAQIPQEKKIYSSGTFKIGIVSEDDVTNTSAEEGEALPLKHALHTSFPNPFTIASTIQYDLPRPEHVTLTLYNMVGREIRTLINGSIPAGKHRVTLQSHGIPSGTYLLLLVAGDYSESQSIIIVK